MAPLAAEVVDWKELGDVLWASFAAGLGVTIAASLAILGTTRAVDYRRSGQPVPATLYSILGLFGVLLVLGSVVLGVVVMTAK